MNKNFIGRKNGHSNTLLKQQLTELIMKNRAEGKAEGVSEAIGMVAAVFMLQLHDKFGFGSGRLEKLLVDVDFTIDCILSGHVSFEDIKNEVENKVNIKLIKDDRKEVK